MDMIDLLPNQYSEYFTHSTIGHGNMVSQQQVDQPILVPYDNVKAIGNLRRSPTSGEIMFEPDYVIYQCNYVARLMSSFIMWLLLLLTIMLMLSILVDISNYVCRDCVAAHSQDDAHSIPNTSVSGDGGAVEIKITGIQTAKILEV
jgi:hypothetical protein